MPVIELFVPFEPTAQAPLPLAPPPPTVIVKTVPTLTLGFVSTDAPPPVALIVLLNPPAPAPPEAVHCCQPLAPAPPPATTK